MVKKLKSAQARWAARQVKMGNCRTCAQPRIKYKQLCDECQAKSTTYMRAYRAAKKAKKENPDVPPQKEAAQDRQEVSLKCV